MTLLQCPICGWLLYVSEERYNDNMEHGRTYTCGNIHGDKATDIIPIGGVHITKIDPDLIEVFDVRNGSDWAYQMYRQFGFRVKENLFQMGKEDPNWLQKFKWTENCEKDFLEAAFRKNARQVRRIGKSRLEHDLAWLSLDVGPGILLNT